MRRRRRTSRRSRCLQLRRSRVTRRCAAPAKHGRGRFGLERCGSGCGSPLCPDAEQREALREVGSEWAQGANVSSTSLSIESVGHPRTSSVMALHRRSTTGRRGSAVGQVCLSQLRDQQAVVAGKVTLAVVRPKDVGHQAREAFLAGTRDRRLDELSP